MGQYDKAHSDDIRRCEQKRIGFSTSPGDQFHHTRRRSPLKEQAKTFPVTRLPIATPASCTRAVCQTYPRGFPLKQVLLSRLQEWNAYSSAVLMALNDGCLSLPTMITTSACAAQSTWITCSGTTVSR